MRLVVDANLTIATIAIDEESAYADATLRALGSDRGLTPALWRWEVANTLLVLERRRRVDDAGRAYADVLRRFPADIDEDMSAGPRRLEEIELARRHALTVYDAAYLALAKRRGVPLATLDAKLARAAEAEGCFFRP